MRESHTSCVRVDSTDVCVSLYLVVCKIWIISGSVVQGLTCAAASIIVELISILLLILHVNGCLYSLDWTTGLENHTQNTNIPHLTHEDTSVDN